MHPSGREMTREDWEDPEARALGMLLNGRVASPGSQPPEAVLLAWFNSGDESVDVMLPTFEACRGWRLVIDTVGKPEEVVDIGASNTRELAAYSVSLYVMIDRHGQLPERL
jgi:glycogen operon protein